MRKYITVVILTALAYGSLLHEAAGQNGSQDAVLSTNATIEPGEAFRRIEGAIADLSKANRARMFSIKSDESKNLDDVFSDIITKLKLLKKKYKVDKNAAPQPVNARELYKEIEQSLSEKDLAAMDTIISLKYKSTVKTEDYSPDPSHCANHCHQTCGYDGVGNKVCWFTCYYCCGHGGC